MTKRITDKERIDWLAKQSLVVIRRLYWESMVELHDEWGSAYRAAIDAAIRAAKKGGRT